MEGKAVIGVRVSKRQRNEPPDHGDKLQRHKRRKRMVETCIHCNEPMEADVDAVENLRYAVEKRHDGS